MRKYTCAFGSSTCVFCLESAFAAQLLEADVKLRAAFSPQRLQLETSRGGGCVGIGNYTVTGPNSQGGIFAPQLVLGSWPVAM